MTSIIFYDTETTDKLINFAQAWKSCIEMCRRDQISFDYLLFKYNVNYMRLPFKDKPLTKIKHRNPHNRNIFPN